MRRLIAFPCAGETLLGTLDTPDMGAPGKTGLLIVSGGNEIRIGAHRGMALLAQRLAARGIAVFRFDRRGIGDSTGANEGFRSSAPDIGRAAATFGAEAGIERLVAFGTCDAASALALFGRAAGIDRVILANPWVIEPSDDLPPAAAIRARYAAKLKDPGEWVRLVRGGVNLRKLVGGLARISQKPSKVSDTLARDVLAAIATWTTDARILLARGDNTAIAFMDAARAADLASVIETCDTDSHGFARARDTAWLEERIVAAIAGPPPP